MGDFKMSASELYGYLEETEINLGQVVNVLNDVGSYAWKYEAQEDVAELVIHRIVGAMLKDIPMSPETRSVTLSALGFSQNAFD